MVLFLARRVGQAALILLGVAAITFVLLYCLPADPAVLIAGRSANPQIVAAIRHELGLDQPLILQFLHYLYGLLHGDFGRSYIRENRGAAADSGPIASDAHPHGRWDLVEVALGLTFGVVAAVLRDGPIDRVIMMLSFVGVSSPQFVVALLLLYVFAATLGWFPMSGFGTPAHVVLPAVTLGVLGAGWYARMVRSAMIEVLRQDYVRTAHAKGLRVSRVVMRHALPNAILPIIAMIGIDIGQFMGGVVVVEAVYGWPGIGQLAWQAIQQVDVPIIMGVTLVSALAIVIGNLLADFIAPVPRPAYPCPYAAKGNQRSSLMIKSLLKNDGVCRDARDDSARACRLCCRVRRPRAATIIVTYKDDIATLDPAIGYDWQNWSMINGNVLAARRLQAGNDRARARLLPTAMTYRRTARPTPSSSIPA